MIKDRNIANDAGIDAGKIAWPYLLDAKFSDGTLPRMVWVGKGGKDNSVPASREFPTLTIGSAIRYRTIDGRGDAVMIGPGSWAETLDIGATNYTKRNLKLIGSGGAYTGITQIIGDGTTALPTIRVRSGYARGFMLANVELDTNTLSQPCLQITTSDTTDVINAATSDYFWTIQNVDVRSGGTPTVGFDLPGATLGRIRNCTVAGCVRGIMPRTSTNNVANDIQMTDIDFYENTTTDLELGGGGLFENVQGTHMRFWDRGGTPVTNYIKADSGTLVNCGVFDATFARLVADDTLLVLGTDFVVEGRCPTTGNIFIVGS